MKKALLSFVAILIVIPLMLFYGKNYEHYIALHSEGTAVYDLKLDITGRQTDDAAKLTFGAGESSLYLDGSMLLDISADSSDQILYRVQIEPRNFRYEYKTDGESNHFASQPLIFYVSWHEDKGFDSFYSENISREGEYIIRAFLELMQVTNIPGRNRWQHKFSTFTGNSEYVFTRRILSSLPFFDNCIEKERVSTGDLKSTGQIEYCFSTSGLRSVKGHLYDEYHRAGTVLLENKSSITLKRVGYRAYEAAMFDKQVGYSQKHYMDGRELKKRLQHRLDENSLMGLSYNELMDSILLPDELGVNDQANLAAALTAYIRLNPSSAHEIMELLYRLDRSDFQYGLILASLSSSSVQEAKLALMEFAERADTADLNQVYFSISLMENADQVSIDFFHKKYNEGQNPEVLFALGIVGDKLTDENYKRVVTEILEKSYNTASDTAHRRSALRAIANTRNVDSTALVIDAYRNESSLRFDAISALGDIKSDDAKSVLLENIDSDNKQVHLAKLRALGEYELTDELISVYHEAIYHGQEFARLQALQNLYKYSGDNRVINFARKYEKECPSEDACAIVARILRNVAASNTP